RALDVGSGPGALTALLVDRLGAAAVSAIDPSEPFVVAARERIPAADVRLGGAEIMPFAYGQFDLTAAQLVVSFMSDPVAGLREMARVTRPGGQVAASVWDLAGDRAPISVLWRAARELNSHVRDESETSGAGAGQLGELMRAAGLQQVTEHELWIHVPFDS